MADALHKTIDELTRIKQLEGELEAIDDRLKIANQRVEKYKQMLDDDEGKMRGYIDRINKLEHANFELQQRIEKLDELLDVADDTKAEREWFFPPTGV